MVDFRNLRDRFNEKEEEVKETKEVTINPKWTIELSNIKHFPEHEIKHIILSGTEDQRFYLALNPSLPEFFGGMIAYYSEDLNTLGALLVNDCSQDVAENAIAGVCFSGNHTAEEYGEILHDLERYVEKHPDRVSEDLKKFGKDILKLYDRALEREMEKER